VVAGSDPSAERPAVSERRRDVRVAANGSAVVRGAHVGRGRVADLSGGGIRIDLADGEPTCEVGAAVEVELHLDRSGSTWLPFLGDVVRVEGRAVAIAFRAVPIAFAGVLEGALRSAVAGAAVAHVLVVDADADRRDAFVALLRRAECTVAVAATPLEAIAHLAASSIHSWVVAIADSDPRTIADELRSFLTESDAELETVSLGPGTTTFAVERLFKVR
jgi:hypothetical protein